MSARSQVMGSRYIIPLMFAVEGCSFELLPRDFLEDPRHDFDGDGVTEEGGDCNDANEGLFPGNAEDCDGIDNDCDVSIDEGVTTTWYADSDGDGVGDYSLAAESCQRPAGTAPSWVLEGGDCDDADPAATPGAAEHCDGVDNDCDGASDEEVVDPLAWYPDEDGDGYGDTAGVDYRCLAPPDGSPEWVLEGGDCDDASAQANPGRDEICGDNLDNDCDGSTDGCGHNGQVSTEQGDAFYEDRSLLNEQVGLEACVGWSLDSPDLDGDGRPELLIGAPSSQALGAESAGAAYIVDPAEGDINLRQASVVLESSREFTGLGYAVLGAEDLTGDNYDDILLGAPEDELENVGRGSVYVIAGPFSAELWQPGSAYDLDQGDADRVAFQVLLEESVWLGHSLASWEQNDDPMLAIGAPGTTDSPVGYRQGAIYLLQGELSPSEIDPDRADVSEVVRLLGGGRYEALGGALAVGDVNGDGLSDLVAGADEEMRAEPGYTGLTYLFLGREHWENAVARVAADAILAGTADGDGLGHAISAAGDVDGDGLADLLIGAPGYNNGDNLRNAGAAYLVLASGLLEGERPIDQAYDALLLGLSPNAEAGTSVAFSEDLYGEGAGILVGSPGYRTEYDVEGEGAVYLLLGEPSGVLSLDAADTVFLGEDSGQNVGFALEPTADADGDGWGELMVGLGCGRGDSRGGVHLFRGGAGY